MPQLGTQSGPDWVAVSRWAGDLRGGPLPVVVKLAEFGDVEGVAVFPGGPGRTSIPAACSHRRAVFEIGAVLLADGRGGSPLWPAGACIGVPLRNVAPTDK
jgi:hypothetical protein